MDRVTLHSKRHRLDQRRPSAPARFFDRNLRLAIHGEDVGTVDDDSLEAVGRCAVSEVLNCMAEVRRGRVGPLVVVDHEHDGQTAHTGEVHSLVGVTPGRSAFPTPRDRNARLLANPKGETHSDRDGKHRRQVTDHRVQTQARVADMDVAVAPPGRPVGATHVLREDPPRLDATRDVHAHVPLQGTADIVRAHCACNADGRSLVAATRVERTGDLPLLIEDVTPFLDPSRGQHAAIHPEQVLAIETDLVRFPKRADGLRFPYCHGSPSAGVGRHSTSPFGGRLMRPARWCRLPSDRWRANGRSATGSRRNAARRSATGSRSASTVASPCGTSSSPSRRCRLRVRAARARCDTFARPAGRVSRRRSSSSARSAVRR